MSFSEPLLSKSIFACSLLFRLSGCVCRNLAKQTIGGAFDAYPLYKHYNTEIDPAFLNVDNMPQDTYELDEINQRSQH
jgi:hypothetical protein